MSACRPGAANSRNATRPSVLAPTSMTARSFSIPTTMPLTTAPSCGLPWVKDSSSICAKSSRVGVADWVAVAMNSPGNGFRWTAVDGVSRAGPKVPRTSTAAKEWRPGPMTRRSKRWFGSGAPSKKRAEQAHPPKAEARSAARPACSDGFDNVDGGPECGVYIQMRGIEQVCLWRRPQGGGRPVAVALVPAANISQHIGFACRSPRPLQLGGAPARTHLGGRRQKNLHVRIRKDDRPDVTPIEHRTGRRASETALKTEERAADFGDGRDQRSRLAHRRGLQGRLVELARIQGL